MHIKKPKFALLSLAVLLEILLDNPVANTMLSIIKITYFWKQEIIQVATLISQYNKQIYPESGKNGANGGRGQMLGRLNMYLSIERGKGNFTNLARRRKSLNISKHFLLLFEAKTVM